MLPEYLRHHARDIASNKGNIKLAIFGPGKGSPFFRKRKQAYRAIQESHPNTSIEFYLIEDFESVVTDDDDYVCRLYPAEMHQIEWADVILFFLTHHKLTAFVEFGLLHSRKTKGSASVFDKCGLAVIDSLEVSQMWFYEAKRLMDSGSDRLVLFSGDDLKRCRVATDLALELFERILIERWGEL